MENEEASPADLKCPICGRKAKLLILDFDQAKDRGWYWCDKCNVIFPKGKVKLNL